LQHARKAYFPGNESTQNKSFYFDGRSNDNFDSISLESGDVTDGIKKYVSVAIVV
jgi:hypothetical protein